jgi:hypothetical protein
LVFGSKKELIKNLGKKKKEQNKKERMRLISRLKIKNKKRPLFPDSKETLIFDEEDSKDSIGLMKMRKRLDENATRPFRYKKAFRGHFIQKKEDGDANMSKVWRTSPIYASVRLPRLYETERMR